ncbi:MAG TPA: sigma factor [Gemmataceae bacterium]|jgi:DNA-directed RNA polymerase specialized sigma24 family protein|nr:sigma factor [Gemmataceae bacterium]
MHATRPEPVAPLVEHFFRHEAGRLVSVLTRIFGWRHFNLVEDMVQATLMDALQAWRVRGVPGNPSGWVHRSARNKIVDALRRDQIGQRATSAWAAARPAHAEAVDELFLDSEMRTATGRFQPSNKFASQPTRSAEVRNFSRARFWICRTRSLLMRKR